MMKYGDKRDYPKRDIHHKGEYKGSTTWAKTNKEAAQKYAEKHNTPIHELKVVKEHEQPHWGKGE